MSLFLSLVWLLGAGPVAGLLMARATGAATWSRAALFAAACQLALVLFYLATQSVPIRSFGRLPTAQEVLMAKAAFVAVLTIIAALLAAGLATAWQWLAPA